VEKAGGTSTNAGHRNAGHRALGFLITSQWVIGEGAARKARGRRGRRGGGAEGEGAARKISVSDTEVKRRFAQSSGASPRSPSKAKALQEYLAKADETEADLLARVKVELLQSRIAAKVTAGKGGAQAKRASSSVIGAEQANRPKSCVACWGQAIRQERAGNADQPQPRHDHGLSRA